MCTRQLLSALALGSAYLPGLRLSETKAETRPPRVLSVWGSRAGGGYRGRPRRVCAILYSVVWKPDLARYLDFTLDISVQTKISR